MKILTDVELRSQWYKTHFSVCTVEAETIITPAARDFLKEHHIRLITDKDPVTEQERGYRIEATGEYVSEKPEDMTHLRGNILVSKTHPRIAFRGKLDSLEAKILETQQIAGEEGRQDLSETLEELLDFVKKILRSEVQTASLGEIRLLGLTGGEIRHMSHHVPENFGISHPTPGYQMGRLCVALNSLRTFVRETELQAVHAFRGEEEQKGREIVEALNRLSSCVYLLFCGELTGKKPYQKDGRDTCKNAAESVGCRRDGIMIEASGRHVHLTEAAIQALFGKSELTKKSELSQPGQFVAQERVRIVTAKGEMENVAVLGPARKEVQVEMSLTDARILGIQIPVNMSGCLDHAADVILAGPGGVYHAAGAAIASKAHIHMTPADAEAYGVRDRDHVAVRLATARPVTIDDVVVRVSRDFALTIHLDYDEANACQYQKGDLGYIV